MKYIDADKLIAEIERLKDRYPSWQLKLAMEDLCNYIDSLQQEQPKEWDLDAIVNEAFDKYSSVDGYGQLAATFNRAELYSFIKKIQTRRTDYEKKTVTSTYEKC